MGWRRGSSRSSCWSRWLVLSVFGANRWGLLAASLSLAAAAALTRPEGLLVAACCVGWFVAHRWFTARYGWIGAGTLALAGPFVVLIGGHFLARYRYYGEWLPNTYYAKHVGPWYESGFRYLWAAAIETGLYLLIPLAVVALRGRWREHRDGIYVLVLLLVGTHLAYLLRDRRRPLRVPTAWTTTGRCWRCRRRRGWPVWAAGCPGSLTRWSSHLSSGSDLGSLATRRFSRRVLFYANAIQGVLILFEKHSSCPRLQGGESLNRKSSLIHENSIVVAGCAGNAGTCRHITTDVRLRFRIWHAVGLRYRGTWRFRNDLHDTWMVSGL